MKRPLMIIGFTLFASLAVFSHFLSAALISILISSAVISLLLLLLSRRYELKNLLFVFIGVTVAAGILVCSNHFVLQSVKKYDGVKTSLKGYVSRISNDGYILKSEIDGQKLKVYIKDYDTSDLSYGEKIRINGAELVFVDSVESSSARSKCKAHGCFLYTDTIENIRFDDSITIENPLEDAVYKLRNYLINVQRREFSGFSYGFIKAVTLGGRRDIPQEMNTAFRRTGLSHVMAISGMHLSIIAGTVFTMLKKFGKRKAAVLSAVVTLFYMTLTGFEPSITRAGIMTITMYLATILRDDYDGFNSLGIACLLMCIVNPYSAADLSLQLSVVSTAGIILILPPVRKIVWKALGKNNVFTRAIMWLSDAFVVSIAANLALIPFYVFVFGTFSIVAPLTNIVSAFFMPLIIVNSLIATLLGSIPVVAGSACVPAFLADISVYAFDKAVKWFAGFKYASIGVDKTFVYIWAIGFAVMLLYATYVRKGKVIFQAVILSVIVLFSSIFCYNINNGSKVSVTTLPIDNNGCTIITYKNHTAVVCGISERDTWYKLKTALSDLSVTDVDLFAVADYDNSAQLVSFIEDYKVDNLVIDTSKINRDIKSYLNENMNLDIFALTDNPSVQFGDVVDIEVSCEGLSKNVYIDADGVVFNMNFGEINLINNYDKYKEIDIALIGKNKPAGLDHLQLSYIVFTNKSTEKEMYKNLLYLTDRFAFSDDSVTFMNEDGKFYIVKERWET